MGQFRVFTTFTLGLFTALGILLALHLAVRSYLQMDLLGDLLLESYGVNFAMAVLIFLGLFLLRERMKSQIGFLFMAGSLFKFALFFLLFYPSYLADGDISKAEFAAFFLPYALALVLETVAVAKLLRSMDEPAS